MKVVLIIIAALFVQATFAQHKFKTVDRNEIGKLVRDNTQPTYYPTLLKRYEAFDTTLTAGDYRLLYYGFVFQSQYRPSARPDLKQVRQLITDKKYKDALAFCDSILKKAPVNMTVNYLKALVLNDMDASESKVLQYRNRYRHLREAILDSGDGFTCESALKVIFKEDEEDILFHYFEIAGSPAPADQAPCEVFSINPSKYFNGTKIFFNVEELGKRL